MNPEDSAIDQIKAAANAAAKYNLHENTKYNHISNIIDGLPTAIEMSEATTTKGSSLALMHQRISYRQLKKAPSLLKKSGIWIHPCASSR